MKNALGYDDALDVFGIHGVGGIIGAIGTGIVAAPSLGGYGVGEYSIGGQLCDADHRGGGHPGLDRHRLRWCSTRSSTWSSACASRRKPEREGLDLADHGERAYNY